MFLTTFWYSFTSDHPIIPLRADEHHQSLSTLNYLILYTNICSVVIFTVITVYNIFMLNRDLTVREAARHTDRHTERQAKHKQLLSKAAKIHAYPSEPVTESENSKTTYGTSAESSHDDLILKGDFL